MRFTSELESGGGNKAGFVVPEAVVGGLGGGSHPKVSVTVDRFTYRSSIARVGDRFMLGMSTERRSEAGVTVGEVYDVDVELDTAPREVDMPEDLGAALEAAPAAQAFWQTLSHSKQQWHVLQVTGAKKPETRAKRVQTSIAMLSKGRAR